MKETLLVILLSTTFACNGSSLNTESNAAICSNILLQIVAPQCKLIPGDKYITFCQDTVSIAAVGCDAGFNESPAIMCQEIANASSGCDLIPFEEGDDVDGPNLCKAGLIVAGMTCTALVTQTEE
jgi:hypothetical protein